jgi:hypothetical protein
MHTSMNLALEKIKQFQRGRVSGTCNAVIDLRTLYEFILTN